ncbi:MAG TPA: (deoxy)nucleoside triphosphate pyrophosphohydrolase [Verrucomicrobiae bacterium]|nr:(deoxy)nucleoside triphosphate pyrophosphohydrolase [Verrucomicrobiae bacterium]
MIVVAAVVMRDGKILACQRSASGKFPLKWEFPGGKIQPNEVPQAALARELEEELNVAAKIGPQLFRTCHKYAEMNESVELFFFKAEIGPSEVENRIFNALKWIEPKKLSELDFLDADRAFIQKLAREEIGL